MNDTYLGNMNVKRDGVTHNFAKEEIKEYTGMSISKSVNSNDVATALKNLKTGTKLYVQGKPQGGQRTMGSVVSVSGDTVKIKPTASNGPTSVKVKDITMMDTLKEELTPASSSTKISKPFSISCFAMMGEMQTRLSPF